MEAVRARLLQPLPRRQGPIEEVKQLNPKGANEEERCITCHVPDIATIGGKVAAQRIPLIITPDKRNPQAHPDRITQAMVTTYGLPSQYADQPIDVTGCMVCHNGQGLATDKEGAHRNLIVNIFDVVDRGQRGLQEQLRPVPRPAG